MQIHLRRAHRGVPEQFGDLIEAAAGVGDVAAERVPQLVRANRPGQPGPPRRHSHQRVDRVRSHRRPDRCAEQVDQHEIGFARPRHRQALELIGVKGLHHQEIGRHHPLTARLRPRPIRVLLARHMQVRPPHLTPQHPGLGQQMHVAAAQPAHLAAAQPGLRHQQHDQPVPRRTAPAQQRHDLLVRGPLDRRVRLAQPMPGPHPPDHPGVLAPRLLGQIPLIGQLIEQRQQPRRGLPRRHRVRHEPAHRAQHRVHPPRPAHRGPARTGQHLPARRRIDPADLRAGVPQPGDEQSQMLHPAMPMPARPRAPAQEQRDPARIRPGRQLRAVAPEPHMPQERVRLADHRQALIQHSPIPHPRRQPHRERPHPPLSDLVAGTVNDYHPRAQHPRRSTEPPARSPESGDVTQQVADPQRTGNTGGAVPVAADENAPIVVFGFLAASRDNRTLRRSDAASARDSMFRAGWWGREERV